MRSKHQFTYSIVDFYKLFYKKQIAIGVPKDQIMPYKKYRMLMEDVLMRISKKIIYENYVFNMPYSLGTLYIKACSYNPDTAKIDYTKTKQAKTLVKFLNRHSFGYHFKFKWDKDYVSFRNRQYYNFKPVRGNDKNKIGKTGLSHHIFDIAKDPNKKSYKRL